MDEYVPQGMPAAPRPLVVALHGCTQSPDVYVDAGWNDLADDWKFYVLYPGQNNTKNNSLGCFNWAGTWSSMPNDFPSSPEPLDLTTIERGQDENESIIQMVDKMEADYPIDKSRVFVTGLSAGGAMTALLLADWPDVFSAGAIFAGIPYGCATDKATTAEAKDCMSGGYTGSDAYLARTPQAWGDLVRKAYPSYTGPYPRVSLWQGTADDVVSPANQTQLLNQWTNVHGASQTPSSTDTVDGFPHAMYTDASGVTVVETYKITGQGHGTPVAPNQPVDPGTPNGEKCGQAGAYFLNAGICSTYYAARFFGLDETSPDGGVSDAGISDAGPREAAGSSTGGASSDAGVAHSGGSIADAGVVLDSSVATTVGSDTGPGAVTKDGGETATDNATAGGGGAQSPGTPALSLGCTLSATGRSGGRQPFALLGLVATALACVRGRRRSPGSACSLGARREREG
jgi:poly(hydroxyalkanoate) depolymerase family esterase